MCGRFVTSAIRELEQFFERKASKPLDLNPPVAYNIAPTMTVPVLYVVNGDLLQDLMAWGFVPHWWQQDKKPGNTINARLEDAAAKPMWRSAMKSFRALVPMKGYYEWRAAAGAPKQPFYIQGTSEQHLAFAALWSSWRLTPDTEPVLTFAILTMEASQSVAEIHHRMPVMLRTDSWDGWLDPAMNDGAAATRFAYERAERNMTGYKVSTYVNAPRNQGPQCMEPLEG